LTHFGIIVGGYVWDVSYFGLRTNQSTNREFQSSVGVFGAWAITIE